MSGMRFEKLLGLCTTVLLFVKSSSQSCDITEFIPAYHGTPFGKLVPHLLPRFFTRHETFPTSNFAQCRDEKSLEDVLHKIAKNIALEQLGFLEITNSNLREIPDFFLNSSTVLEMKLSNCRIHTIKPKAFALLGSLQLLDLENNEIAEIKDGQFNNLKNLSDLDLSFNLIKTIRDGAFDSLSNLKTLNLQNNLLARLPDNIIRNVSSLEVINLGFNKLEHLNENMFQNQPNLSFVQLNDNNFAELSPNLFVKNKKLDKLQISNNHVSSLDDLNLPESCTLVNASKNTLGHVNLKSVSNIEILDLSDTGLFTVLTPRNMSTQQLYLNDNHLGHDGLGGDLFGSFQKLETLFLDNNDIEELRRGVFVDNTLLKKLSLGANLLMDFDAKEIPPALEELNLTSNFLHKLENLSHLKNLTILQLGFNNFAEVTFDFFQGLTKLQTLLLNNNNLTKLELGCFRDLKKLDLLDLSHNNIARLELGVFGGLADLKNLNLGNNKLTTLEAGVFHSFSNLRRLDISYNELKFLDVKNTLSHIVPMFEVSLEGNNWSCEFIIDIIGEFKRMTVKHGNETGVTNVKGIACTNRKDGDSINGNPDKQFAMGFRDLSEKLATNNIVLILILLLLIVERVAKYGSECMRKLGLLVGRMRRDKDIQLIP